MTPETTFDVPASRQEVIITRLFRASAQRVFAAHTDAGPEANRVTMARRVGSERARNVTSRVAVVTILNQIVD